VVVVAFLLWLTFFSGPGAVEVATLGATVVSLVWFATVDSSRLVDETGRPQALLFVLGMIGLALLVTAAAFLSSAITFLILFVGLAALVTGLVRAIRYGMAGPRPQS
jgi:hypothetical protein